MLREKQGRHLMTKLSIYDLYKKMPIPLQNLLVSTKGLQIRYQRYGAPFWEKFEFLRQSEWWSKEKIREYQDEQLRHLIRHAYETVPYYNRIMKKRGLTPNDIKGQDDLPKLPLLTKEEVFQHTEELVSTKFPRWQLIKSLTSGTTGKALKIYLTREALSFQWAVWWRHRARFGLKPGDKFLTFGARVAVPIEQTKPPYWRYNLPIHQVYLSTYHLTPYTMPYIVEWLNKENFDFYTGYPSAMYILASFMEENGLRLFNRPKYIVTGADALLPTFEQTIKRVFGVPVTEEYGMAEAVGNFSKCEYGKFHLDAEFGIVELLPVDNQTNPNLRRLVFTGLANLAMPLIRYDIGDYGKVDLKSCPCNRQTLTLESIDGRVEDYIRTPDGRMAIGMNQVFEWAPGAREIQIVQNSLSKIEVCIVPRPSYSKNDENKLLCELRKRLGNQIEIKFKLVQNIPRTKSGKFHAVVSTLKKKR